MSQDWHLYMDETGNFESNRDHTLSIVGILVPDDKREELACRYLELKKQYGFGDRNFMHATKLGSNEKGKEFIREAGKMALNSEMTVFRMTHKNDLYTWAKGDILSETFAANRYLMMAESVLEYMVFLNPESLGQDLSFFLHPNSRVFLANETEDALVERYREMGFQPGRTKNPNEAPFFFIWDEKALRIYMQRLATQFSPFKQRLGDHDIRLIEMPVAKKSSDPFVHWSDNLCYAFRHRIVDPEDEAKLKVDLAYGEEHGRFADLIRTYLGGDLKSFLFQSLSTHKTLITPYYRNSLDTLFDLGIRQIGDMDGSFLKELMREMNEQLRSSSLEWLFVLGLIDCMLRSLQNLPLEAQALPENREMLVRLYEHLFNIHNHRGEYALAWNAAQAIEKARVATGDHLAFEKLLEQADFRNRQAVMAANVFQFQTGNRLVRDELRLLESLRDAAQQVTGQPITMDRIGKFKGTMGQNMAFLAPREPAFFPGAEAMFLAARGEFLHPSDRLRQDLYLFHLYMDWGKHGQAEERLMAALKAKEWCLFQADPSKETSRFTAFTLFALLKYSYSQRPDEDMAALERYTLSNLCRWYEDVFFEHPFELIYGYLGRMACRQSLDARAKDYFEHALSVPKDGEPDKQETLQAIRAQIFTWWALESMARDDRLHAGRMMGRAASIIESLGRRKELAPMLSLEGDRIIGGWFAEACKALRRVNWEKDFDQEACYSLLSCFTFNYH